MAQKKTRTPRTKNIVRASISFPGEQYSEIQRLATAKKVSTAWIVREAIEKYLADQWPLLSGRP
jgi:predicted DNA-binding protein